ncbi:hypothetical protein JCM15765_39950 [Paradesulfitobacterium aromaticivorans]
MAHRWCKPLSIEGIPKKVRDSAFEKLVEVRDMINLKGNKFVSLGPITIFQTDLEDVIEHVKASTKETKSKSKDRDDIPKEIKNTIDRLKEEQDLTQKEIKKLERELRTKEFKLMEKDKKIRHLEQQAKILGNQRHCTRVKQKFEKNYEKFLETLNDDLLYLELEDKKDIKVLLENMSETIVSTINKL